MVAFVKRRRWVKDHPLILPALSEAREGAGETR
jgi:hypothetical protein